MVNTLGSHGFDTGCRRGAASGSEFGQTEIQNFGVAALGDKDVRGLDVAVNDALRVSGVKSVGDFDANIEQNFHVKRATLDEMLESLTVEKFHGDERFSIFVANVIDGADAGVVQGGGGLRFPLETCQRLRIVSHFIGKEFQGNKTVQARVFGFVHDTHAAPAELLDNAVMRDGLADERLGLGHLALMVGFDLR